MKHGPIALIDEAVPVVVIAPSGPLFEKTVSNMEEVRARGGQVVLIDEHTGRMLSGRRYNEGLHQSIEAKEGVEVKAENQTLATVTLQNFFRLYLLLVLLTEMLFQKI